jgi:hypothetical protein
MLELGSGADIFRALSLLHIAGIALAAVVVYWLVPGKRLLRIGVTLVVLGFLVLPFIRSELKARAKMAEHEKRLDAAATAFKKRCESAGEKIYKTVSGEKGIYLMKPRPVDSSPYSRYSLHDPFGRDLDGDGYPETMLWGKNDQGDLIGTSEFGRTYEYVVMNTFGGLVQYQNGPRKPNHSFTLVKSPTNQHPRYGVTYEDLSTDADRDNWIAGGVLKVVDTKTGEVLGERIGWMFDRGLGSTANGRAPWMEAAKEACPAFPRVNVYYPRQIGQTRRFVEKVVRP